VRKKGEPHLHNVVMFSFGSTILLMGVGARNLMVDAKAMKKGIRFLILPTPIGLDGKNLAIKPSLNKVLKFKKMLKHLGFRTKQIDSGEFTIIIDETHIVFLVVKRINSKAPHNEKNKS
jgi:hypothetical protein